MEVEVMSKKELSDLKEKIELYQHRPFFKSLDNSISTIPLIIYAW